LPDYVVQITVGGESWIARQHLEYNPHIGTGTPNNINHFSTFIDEYIEGPGSVTSGITDYNSNQGVIKLEGTTRVKDLSYVPGPRPFPSQPRVNGEYSTYDILSTSPPNTTPYRNVPDCLSWPLP
jgi:hypothetical protein